MTQEELVNKLCTRYQSSHRRTDISELLHGLGDIAREELGRGGEVPLPGLGKLRIQTKPPRNGRHPRTGEPIVIAARRVVKLAPTGVLKEVLAAAA